MTTVLQNPNTKQNTFRKRTKTVKIKKSKEYTQTLIEKLLSNNTNETQVESFYNKKDLLELKKKILIYRIKMLRNESALKIQTVWKKKQMRLNAHKLAHKVRGCYTICPKTQNACRMYIKIYTNELKREEYKILSLSFCQIRKCFVRDIPKNKFYTSKKIMYFNLIKNNEIFFDDNYEKILYNNQFVHKVDFSIYDKRQKLLDETIYNPNHLLYKRPKNFNISNNSKESIYLSTEDEKENSENTILTPEKFGGKEPIFRFSSNELDKFKGIEEEDEDEYEGLRPIKRAVTNEPMKVKKRKSNKTIKRFESFDVTHSYKFKLKSILRDSNCEELHKRKLNMESSKKVTFGKTVYFY
jgi:hypothetical protein